MIRIYLLLTLSFLATSANALLINGDFETGNLTGWTTFTTTNGTIGTPSVSSFDVTGSGSSLAAEFRVGNIQNPGNNGGGIFQTFNFGGGSLSVSVDVASLGGSANNSDGGEFSLLIDGVLVDFLDFGGISSAPTTERGTLSGVVNGLSAGLLEFRVLTTRSFEANNTPFQYIDNAVASGAAGPAPVPAPATLALFGLGLAGLGWSRRKKA